METLLLRDTPDDIWKAAEILARGGLVTFPTETVYGLGADARNSDAVRKIYLAKGRPSDNPMIVHIADKEDLAEMTPVITEDMKKLSDSFWPGPMTMIVRRMPDMPDTTTGGLDTVGIRLPSNYTARALIRMAGCPVAAPSANLSGRPSTTTFEHCVHDLSGKVDAIIDGGSCTVGIESTVIDMTSDTPTILRPGIITREMFRDVLGKDVALDKTLTQKPDVILDPSEFPEGSANAKNADGNAGAGDFRPKSPGMKYKHYAPAAEMRIFEGKRENVERAIADEKSRLEADGKKVAVILHGSGESEEIKAAHDLFAELRQADADGADVILAAALPEEGVGFSVMNRMLKSAGYNITKV